MLRCSFDCFFAIQCQEEGSEKEGWLLHLKPCLFPCIYCPEWLRNIAIFRILSDIICMWEKLWLTSSGNIASNVCLEKLEIWL